MTKDPYGTINEIPDSMRLNIWMHTINNAMTPETPEWYCMRNMRSTLYGRTVCNMLATFMSCSTGLEKMIELVSKEPSIMDPCLVPIHDDCGHLDGVKLIDDESDFPIDDVRRYDESEIEETMTQMSIAALTMVHAINRVNHLRGKMFKLIGELDGKKVFKLVDDPSRHEPSNAQRAFIEDNYPVTLMRDIALHSIITGDEVLIDAVDDPDWAPDPKSIGNVIDSISSFDCTWLLSETERIIGMFMATVYRSVSYGYYSKLINNSPESIERRYWDALWEEASTEHEIILKTVDRAFPLCPLPESRCAVMTAPIALDDMNMESLQVNGSDSTQDRLKALICNLMLKTNQHKFDVNTRVLNEITGCFETSTYSVVLNARNAIDERIDPLAPLPESIFENESMDDIIKRFEESIEGLLKQDDVRLQYLGRRKTDGRLAFIYVDSDGNTVVPEQVIRIQM